MSSLKWDASRENLFGGTHRLGSTCASAQVDSKLRWLHKASIDHKFFVWKILLKMMIRYISADQYHHLTTDLFLFVLYCYAVQILKLFKKNSSKEKGVGGMAWTWNDAKSHKLNRQGQRYINLMHFCSLLLYHDPQEVRIHRFYSVTNCISKS